MRFRLANGPFGSVNGLNELWLDWVEFDADAAVNDELELLFVFCALCSIC